MKKLIFVTGNKSKFQDVQRYLKHIDSNIELQMEDLDVPELQSLNVEKIAKEKAAYAWNILKKPLIVDDGGIFIEQYNQFPGALSKHVVKGIGLAGIWKLAENNPRAHFMCCIAYQDETDKSYVFTGTCPGKIIPPVGAIRNPDFPYTDIFVPDGSEKTYAQLREDQQAASFSHRRLAVEQLDVFLRNHSMPDASECTLCNHIGLNFSKVKEPRSKKNRDLPF